MTETRTEYGNKKQGGEVTWPDEDEQIYFDKLPDRDYGGWIPANELPRLQAAAKASGTSLVQRTVTYGPVEDVKPPLPTTPGSVVRATVNGEGAGIFGLTSDGDDIPWRRVDGDGDYHAPHVLTDVTVIFDAGATA